MASPFPFFRLGLSLIDNKYLPQGSIKLKTLLVQTDKLQRTRERRTNVNCNAFAQVKLTLHMRV